MELIEKLAVCQETNCRLSDAVQAYKRTLTECEKERDALRLANAELVRERDEALRKLAEAKAMGVKCALMNTIDHIDGLAELHAAISRALGDDSAPVELDLNDALNLEAAISGIVQDNSTMRAALEPEDPQ
jgi:hypothetical protein